jgi:uncharacterized protein YegP (UPF0339 family)
MRRVIAGVVLAVSLAVVGSSVLTTPADAQDKTKAKAKKEAAVGTVEVYKAKDGYRYRIKNAEGKVVAMPPPSRHYDNKEDAVKELEEIKATLEKVKPTEVKD